MLMCNCCENPKSNYFMHGRRICLECDQFLFEIQMECDETSGEVTDEDVLALKHALMPRTKTQSS